MPDKIRAEWQSWAEKLLDKRDRYTRNAIRTEFERSPRERATALDAALGWYATPVASNRFTVVWRLNESEGKAEVAAVFPTQFVGESPEQLKRQVMEAVEQESGGKVKLF